jgi:tetratricopeptide (TPR) repeat protein
MKRNKIYTIKLFVILAVALSCTTSCKKFLDEKPSKSEGILITTASGLDAVLNNYLNFYSVGNNVAVYSTDDNGLSDVLYAARPTSFPSSVVQYSCWDIANLPQTDQALNATNLWNGEYSKIYIANTVLANVDQVSGSAAEKAALKADAAFIRAYSYWTLANAYCLPYTDANKNEPGLPVKTKPDYDLAGRGTLADTYAQISADLAEALKTTVPLVQGGTIRMQRANVAAVNAFAARYYLSLNDYANALKYANAALAAYGTLVDYNTGMRNGNSSTITINSGKPNQQTVVVNFPYTHDKATIDPTDIFGWKEMLYYRLAVNSNRWFIPSQELMNLYDQTNDLRFKYHYIQNYSYIRGMSNPSYSYPGYVFFADNAVIEGPTTAEMYLIKAECEARSGDFNTAINTVNQLYSKRTLTGTAALTASSQAQAITVILQERRREMPFRQRWVDIRRLNSNSDPNDDVSLLSRTFFPYTATSVNSTAPVQVYTLPKGSRRFASPLPLNDINASNGLLPQNAY